MSLSREQTAEVRRVAATGIPHAAATNVSNVTLLALLDAYEATRPRGASEVPDSNRPVCGWYWHPSAGWDVRAAAWHQEEWWDQHLCGLVDWPVWWTEFAPLPVGGDDE